MRKFNFNANVNEPESGTQVSNNNEEQCPGGFIARNKKPILATAAALAATAIGVIGFKTVKYFKARKAAAAQNAEETPANDAAKK